MSIQAKDQNVIGEIKKENKHLVHNNGVALHFYEYLRS
jgi:hypothetical protein